MADEHGISFPDGGMCASDSGMSIHSCNKSDYHYKVKDLTRQLSEARDEIARLRKALEAIKHRHVPMTSRDEYRRGYTDAISIVQLIAKAALEDNDE